MLGPSSRWSQVVVNYEIGRKICVMCYYFQRKKSLLLVFFQVQVVFFGSDFFWNLAFQKSWGPWMWQIPRNFLLNNFTVLSTYDFLSSPKYPWTLKILDSEILLPHLVVWASLMLFTSRGPLRTFWIGGIKTGLVHTAHCTQCTQCTKCT